MKPTFARGDVCVEPDALFDGLLADERQRAACGVDVAKIDRLLAL